MNLSIRCEFVLLSYIFTAHRCVCVCAYVRTYVHGVLQIRHIAFTYAQWMRNKSFHTVMSLKLLILSKRAHIRVRKSVKFEWTYILL